MLLPFLNLTKPKEQRTKHKDQRPKPKSKKQRAKTKGQMAKIQFRPARHRIKEIRTEDIKDQGQRSRIKSQMARGRD